VTFREFIQIIEQHGFALLRQGKGSHRMYRGIVNGRVMQVVVAYHNINDEIRAGTLASMIRQTGLSKKLFRNKN
jgi:predicted RNA binding protein YcfA (HicA-like mRNA interferase family)